MPTNPNAIVALFFTIISFGYLFKRIGLLKIKDSKLLVNIIFYFTLPAVILKTFHKANLSFDMLNVFIVSFLFGILMTLLGIFFFRKNSDNKQKGLMISSCMGFNIGLFAYPFVQAMWGKQGLLYLAIFDLANAFMIFGVSYIIATIYSPSINKVNYLYILKKLAIFIPLQCYIIAILLASLHVKYPSLLLDFLNFVSGANSVLVLLLIGMFISFRIDRGILINVLKVLSLRYIIGIAIALILFFIIPLPLLIQKTILLGLVLPVAMSIIPYSIMFNYNSKLAGALVNLSSIISFVFMWIVITSF